MSENTFLRLLPEWGTKREKTKTQRMLSQNELKSERLMVNKQTWAENETSKSVAVELKA